MDETAYLAVANVRCKSIKIVLGGWRFSEHFIEGVGNCPKHLPNIKKFICKVVEIAGRRCMASFSPA